VGPGKPYLHGRSVYEVLLAEPVRHGIDAASTTREPIFHAFGAVAHIERRLILMMLLFFASS
jgi:hypothetical protein